MWQLKTVAGIVEGGPKKYTRLLKQAENSVDKIYDAETVYLRPKLIKAIKLNIINRKQYKIEDLIDIYGLNISASTFKRQKSKYANCISKGLEL